MIKFGPAAAVASTSTSTSTSNAAKESEAEVGAIQVKIPCEPPVVASFTNPINLERYLLKNEILVYHTKVYRYSFFQPLNSQRCDDSYDQDQKISMRIRYGHGEIGIVRKGNDYPHRFRFGLFDPTEPKWICNEVIKEDLKLEHEASTATLVWKSVTDRGNSYPLSMKLWNDDAATCFMKVFEGCQKLEFIQMKKRGLVNKPRLDLYEEMLTEREKQLRDWKNCAAKFFKDLDY